MLGKKLRLFKKHDEEGYVIVAVLGVAFLAVMIVSSISAITISDLIFNAKVRAAIEARHAAESALDSYYAAINSGEPHVNDVWELSKKFSVVNEAGDGNRPIGDPTESNADDPEAPADFDFSVTRKASDFSDTWFQVDQDGNLEDCVESSEVPCFKMRLSEYNTRYVNSDPNSGGGFGGFDQRTEFVTEVVVRHKCRNYDDENPKGCTFARFQQQFRQREFISHVLISESEELSPQALSVEGLTPEIVQKITETVDHNSIAVDDAITGNIHTNYESFFACNNININGLITSGGDSVPLAPTFSTGGFEACKNLPNDLSDIKAFLRQGFYLPTRSQDQEGTRLKALASLEHSNYVVEGDAIIRFDGKKVEINGNNIDLPSFGVIYVKDDATVFGEIDGKVTVFAGGNITVGEGSNTHLRYTNMNTSLIGLLAKENIILDCHIPSGSTACMDKTVHALMVANTVDGTILNNRWATSRASGVAPKLTVVGSMVSGYRGTYGAMSAGHNPADSGKVNSGWVKDFHFDGRLKHEQPPYMLRDALAKFIRSTSKDLPCEIDICK